RISFTMLEHSIWLLQQVIALEDFSFSGRTLSENVVSELTVFEVLVVVAPSATYLA
ncbi:hypothetical protein MKX03_028987, partial [Papaver bracteatum]